jgi:hypothetical protein
LKPLRDNRERTLDFNPPRGGALLAETEMGGKFLLYPQSECRDHPEKEVDDRAN